MKIVKAHFTINLDMINSRPCYICGGLDTYRDREDKKTVKKEVEISEPGDFIKHEDKYIVDLGHVAIFECSKCHNLLFFRSHFDEEVDLLE